MTAIVWQPIRDALAIAVAARPGASPAAVIGSTILARLNSLGPVYDARFTPAVAASKEEAERAYSAKLGAWLNPRFKDVDDAARWAEAQQVAANTGRVPNPYLQSVGGADVVLAPATRLPVVASVSPARAASAQCGDLIVTALATGYLGNSITVTITDTLIESPVPLPPGFFRVVVALGAYQEIADPRMPGGGLVSWLIGGAWNAAPARPPNGVYALRGAGGDCVVELLGRIRRASALPAILADRASKTLLDDFASQAQAMNTGRPRAKFQNPYAAIRDQEIALAELVERASRWLAITHP